MIKTLALRASNGQYVCAEGGGNDEGIVVANRDRFGSWETFALQMLGSGTIALVTVNGRFLCAEKGGGGTVHANRQEAGAWEAWKVVGDLKDGARIGLMSHDGHYLCAEEGGGGAVTATRVLLGAWETFMVEVIEEDPDVTARPPVTQRGQLRIVKSGFADDAGPTNPVFCHAGDLFAAYTRTPEAVVAQLDVIVQAGYRGIRFWTVLGGPYWERWQRTVGPDVTSQYWARVHDFLFELRVRGLSAIISQGDVGQIRERRAFMRELASVVNEVGSDVAAMVDGGNEAWQTGEPDPAKLSEMVSAFRAVCPGPLLTLTSPQGETKAELDAYSIVPADLYDVHGSRAGHWWDKVRHIFSLAYEGKPARRLGVQSEPTGPGELVSVTDFKHELTDDTLAAMAVMSLLARQAWVYMSTHGVVWRGPLESQPGFWSVPKAVALLPKDITSWPTLVHGGEAWAHRRVFAAHGDTRWDHALSADGRFAALGDGPDDVTRDRPDRVISRIDLDHLFGNYARLVVGRL